jgi:hypothetical protein
MRVKRLCVLLFVFLIACVITSCDQKTSDQKTSEQKTSEHEHTWSENSCTLGVYCIECGETLSPASGHDYSEATCTSYATCKVCGHETGGLKEHQYSETDGTCEWCGGGVKFILPTTPQNISCTSGYDQACKIEKITITKESYNYTLTFLVQSTYHKKGSSYSDRAVFGWKLYDEDGLVVKSGTGYTDAAIKVGEKSKDSIPLFIGSDSDEVQEGKTYYLELVDIG